MQSLYQDEDWALFFQVLDECEPIAPIPIELQDINLWKDALKNLKSRSARGACGWHVDELKMIPENSLRDLVKVFDSQLPGQFPAHLMRARVIALKKTADADTAKQTRENTILSLVYRLWSRTTTRAILTAWTNSFPAAITGFLPSRSVQHFQYSLQFSYESALRHRQAPQYGGLTIDLAKAFNTLPRLPCKKLLIHLGVPPKLVEIWFASLNQLQRHWQVGGTLLPSQAVTTGAPEGDAWSVCCMLSIN